MSELNERGHGVLFTVDDVDPHVEALETFADAFQHLVRERRDVAMLLAGTQATVDTLLLEGNVTFLRRAFQRELYLPHHTYD